ncbi:hypothetical protein F5Y14DRAFT_394489 [Nemania sp. NC0429]|nr:hypothetical protein F5Y14DRAFT_394489 [Nemania sp. NC0429]
MANRDELWSYHRGRWNTTKLILRNISLILSVVLVAVSIPDGILVTHWSQSLSYPSIDYWFTLPIAIVSTFLDCAELAASVVWKRNPGLHPGCHVAGEIILLGGNAVAFAFITPSVDIMSTWYYDSTFPTAVGPLKAALVTVLGLFTIDRLILFTMACMDTHRHHANAQVEMIVQALRQHNLGDPAIAAILQNSSYAAAYPNDRQPVPAHEPWPKPQPVRVSDSDASYHPELPENQKFLASIRSNLH